MKECRNVYCEADTLFDDHLKICPYCGETLYPAAEKKRQTVQTGNSWLLKEADEVPAAPPLVTPGRLGRRVLRGRLIEMEKTSLFYGRFQRFWNSVLFGMPYQLGHQTLITVVRIEEDTALPGRALDVHCYGEYTGRLVCGDMLQITCTGRHNRMAKKILNHTTGSVVRPNGLQIPAFVVRLAAAAVLALVVLLVYGAAAFFTTGQAAGVFGLLLGALVGAAGGILSAVGPCLVMLAGIWLIVTIPFRK